MSFWLLRIALLRSFFFIYAVAFLIALSQNEALIGDNGLTPAKRFWEVVIRKRFGTVSPWAGFVQYPSLFWWIPVSRLGCVHHLATTLEYVRVFAARLSVGAGGAKLAEHEASHECQL